MPSSGSPSSLQEKKAQLRQRFVQQLPTRVTEGRELLGNNASALESADTLERLRTILHTIKGSSASFGLHAISAAAHEGQDHVIALAAEPGSHFRKRVWRELQLVLANLDQLIQEAASDPPPAASGFDLQVTPHSTGKSIDTASAREGSLAATVAGRAHRLVFVCDDDPEVSQNLADQLACFGYGVRALTSIAELEGAVQMERPAALVMDVVFPEGQHAGASAITHLMAKIEGTIPTVFISSEDDFDSRLHALRAGGRAYCTKPIKTVQILEMLDQLTNPQPSEPINVLIVDDDSSLAHYHAAIMENAGFTTRTVTDPARVLETLAQFSADLVLMDMYMPVCSGPELARMLRQIPGYVSLPIIYVSSETDVKLQRGALAEGADGFMIKPVDPAALAAEVRLRAERMRILHSLMVRDGLTGLFNHNTLLQFLGVALANAARSRTDLTFVMIDLDHFKAVNDTYGHPIGDQVIIALSQTLRLRLRESDVVGRYGGEEFGVVLNHTDLAAAHEIIDDLRQSFAAVRFFADGQEFHCTFSAGIAGMQEFQRPENLTEAADQALYRAKRRGRNCVVRADPADINAEFEP